MDSRSGSGIAARVEAVGALPAWLSAAVERAEAEAGPGQLPVLVLDVARPGKLGPKRLAIIPADWLDGWRRR